MFHVYVLLSATTGRRYVGSCEDVHERVRRHNAGHSKSTRYGVPWVLVHQENFMTRAEAVRKERYYKSGRGRDDLERFHDSAVAAATGRRFKSLSPRFEPDLEVGRLGDSPQPNYFKCGNAATHPNNENHNDVCGYHIGRRAARAGSH